MINSTYVRIFKVSAIKHGKLYFPHIHGYGYDLLMNKR